MRVTAVAHDPGGANAVAATVAALRARGDTVEAFAKGPAVRQFAQLAVACTPVPADQGAIAAAPLPADLLLAGTSADDPFELDAIAAATARRIPTLAVLDYWSNYHKRFVRGSGAPRWPDLLTAIDAGAAAAMAADGLPADRIRVTGQPYFAWLIRGGAVPRRQASGTLPRVLFASQPDAREQETLACVAAALAGRASLTVRFHPRQRDRDASLELLRRAGAAAVIEDRRDTLACLPEHDLILGISSTILLEAALLGQPAASVMLDGVPDPLAAVRQGLIPVLRSPDDIRAFLRAPRAPAPSAKFLAAQRGADERVATLCHLLVSSTREQRAAS